MNIAHLVHHENGDEWYWSDTDKIARIKRNIGEPQTFDLSEVHGRWRSDPIEFLRMHIPDRSGLPKRTDVSFYVVGEQLEGDKPYITAQYVEAKR